MDWISQYAEYIASLNGNNGVTFSQISAYPEKHGLHVQAMYKRNIHMISLISKGNRYYWLMQPYLYAYYETFADYPESFNLVLLAIAEHMDVHGY